MRLMDESGNDDGRERKQARGSKLATVMLRKRWTGAKNRRILPVRLDVPITTWPVLCLHAHVHANTWLFKKIWRWPAATGNG